MAVLNGYTRTVPIAPDNPTIQIGGPAQLGSSRVAIDGTPARVVLLAVAAAAGLAALKWAGIRFNVGIS